jgi:hypothetical protein
MLTSVKQLIRVALTGSAVMAASLGLFYFALTTAIPAGTPVLRVIFIATAGISASILAMALHVMWVKGHDPERRDIDTLSCIVPPGGATVLCTGWLAVSLPVGWPYGALASTVAVVVGVAIISWCHMWSVGCVSRQARNKDPSHGGTSSVHDAV